MESQIDMEIKLSREELDNYLMGQLGPIFSIEKTTTMLHNRQKVPVYILEVGKTACHISNSQRKLVFQSNTNPSQKRVISLNFLDNISNLSWIFQLPYYSIKRNFMGEYHISFGTAQKKRPYYIPSKDRTKPVPKTIFDDDDERD